MANWRAIGRRLAAAWRALRGPAGEEARPAAAVRPALYDGAVVYARVAGAVRLVQITGRGPAGGWLATYEERTARGGRTGLFLVRDRDFLTADEAAAVFRAEAARRGEPASAAPAYRFTRERPGG